MSNATAHPLLTALSEKRRATADQFAKQHTFAHQWLVDRGLTVAQIRARSAKLLTGATLGSALLLVSPQLPLINQNQTIAAKAHATLNDFLLQLHAAEKETITENEGQITADIKKYYGLETTFTLDYNRLPQYVGMMGLEQHLYRSVDDDVSKHDEFQIAGIAPARGAFGYFAREGVSQERMIAEEKYYIVLQTFMIPEWNRDWVRLKPWYAFRKFLVINPETGQAVVVVLGDSGPAVWTGKQFGGSPEVMAGLGWYPDRTKGKMVILFVDDPGGTVPLGPISPKQL